MDIVQNGIIDPLLKGSRVIICVCLLRRLPGTFLAVNFTKDCGGQLIYHGLGERKLGCGFYLVADIGQIIIGTHIVLKMPQKHQNPLRAREGALVGDNDGIGIIGMERAAAL